MNFVRQIVWEPCIILFDEGGYTTSTTPFDECSGGGGSTVTTPFDKGVYITSTTTFDEGIGGEGASTTPFDEGGGAGGGYTTSTTPGVTWGDETSTTIIYGGSSTSLPFGSISIDEGRSTTSSESRGKCMDRIDAQFNTIVISPNLRLC